MHSAEEQGEGLVLFGVKYRVQSKLKFIVFLAYFLYFILCFFCGLILLYFFAHFFLLYFSTHFAVYFPCNAEHDYHHKAPWRTRRR